MKYIAADLLYFAEYESGLIWITRATDLKSGCIDLRNNRNQSVVKGQFDSSVKSHGASRALHVFAKLVTDWRAVLKPQAAQAVFVQIRKDMESAG
jgi:hypothetical protein